MAAAQRPDRPADGLGVGGLERREPPLNLVRDRAGEELLAAGLPKVLRNATARSFVFSVDPDERAAVPVVGGHEGLDV